MNQAQQTASVVQPPASVASTATTTCTFDTIGTGGIKYDYAVVRVFSGTQTTTDPAITVLKLTESDDGTTYAAITGLTGGTAANTSGFFVIPAVTVSGLGCGVELQIDLRKRKRYLKLNITPGTTLVYGAHVELSRAKETPTTAALKSVSNSAATNVTGVATLVQI